VSNATRVMLDEEIGEVVSQAELDAAYRVMEEAFDIQQREQRPMTLAEALVIIRQVSEQVEALG
jgi:hypothetical protein